MSQLGHTSSDTWLLDTGASHHMCPFVEHFDALVQSSVDSVRLADDSIVPVLGEGDVGVRGIDGRVVIRSVLYVPALSTSLLSIPAVYEHGGRVVLQSERATLYSKGHGSAVCIAHREGRSWVLKAEVMPAENPKTNLHKGAHCLLCDASPLDGFVGAVQGAGTSGNKAPWQVWHARLGHVGLGDLKRMHQLGLAQHMELEGQPPDSYVCDACLEGKMHMHPFETSKHRAEEPFGKIHMDLMGPMEVPSAVYKSRYVMTLIDDHTRYAWVYFLRKKSHASRMIKEFFAWVDRQYKGTIRSLRSDRGAEFL